MYTVLVLYTTRFCLYLSLILLFLVLSTVSDILKSLSKYLLKKLIIEQVKEHFLSGKAEWINIP